MAAAVAGCGEQPTPPPSETRVVARLQAEATGSAGALAFAVVPDARDGVSNVNPPGTVEVFSSGTATPLLTVVAANAPGSLCGAAPGIHATVRVKNYATEQLANVAVEFTDIVSPTHVVCNLPPPESVRPPGASTALGLIGYPSTIAGASVDDGSAPGGDGVQDWWFNYQSPGSFTFKARVWADVLPAPPSSPSPAPGAVFDEGEAPSLSWTGSTLDGFVKIGTTAALAAPVVAQAVPGASSFPLASSAAFTPETAYFWKAGNRFPSNQVGPLVNGTFTVGGSYAVAARPLMWRPDGYDPTYFAPAGPVELLAELSVFAEGARFYVCESSPCTGANDLAGGAGLRESGTFYSYAPTSLVSGHYWAAAANVVDDAGVTRTLAPADAQEFWVDGAPTLVGTQPTIKYPMSPVNLQATTPAPSVNFYFCGPSLAGCDPDLGVGYLGSMLAGGVTASFPVDAGSFPTAGTYWWLACTEYGFAGLTPDLQGVCSAPASFAVVTP